LPRENEWVNKNVNLNLLAQRIENFFREDGFTDVMKEEDQNGQWWEIQARKTGIVRTVVGSRKAIHILIRGKPDKFKVVMDVGDWGKNIAAGAVLGMLTAGIALIGVGLTAEFQHKLWNRIQLAVDSLASTYVLPEKEVSKIREPAHKQEPSPLEMESEKKTSKVELPSPYSEEHSNITEQKLCSQCNSKIPKLARYCSTCGIEQSD